MVEVVVKDQDLQKAALEGMDEFIDVFVKAIYDAIGGELTAESMQQLNADQLTLLAWKILHDEVMDGGFVQLIYNGYGPFIFKNPIKADIRCSHPVAEISRRDRDRKERRGLHGYV